MGAAVRWILPSDTNTLVDLTNELGFEKGGQTIDSLLQGGKNVLNLTRELGFQNTEETLKWSVPTDTNRLVELTKELGFNNGAQTLDLLLSVIPQLMSNAEGKDVPHKLPPEQFQAPTFQQLRGDPGPSYSSQEQNNRILPGEIPAELWEPILLSVWHPPSFS